MSDSPSHSGAIPVPQAPVDPEKILGALPEMSDDEALESLENMLAVLTRDLGRAQA